MMLLTLKGETMTDENLAALDDNMPPSDEVLEPVVDEVTTEVTAASNTEVPSEDPQVIEISPEQKALNKLAFEKREEKRQRIALEERLATLEAGTPKEPTQAEAAPTLAQFDYDEQAFNQASIKYQVNLATKDILSKQEEQQAQVSQQAAQNAFNTKVIKLTEAAPDYADVVGNLPQFPNDTLNAIMETDNGPQLAYYLGNHLDVADNIANLPSMQAAIQLGMISSQLSNAKPTIKPSAAPEPIAPVNSSGSVATKMEDMSMDQIYEL